MKILATIVFGYFLVVGKVGEGLGGSEQEPARLVTGMTDSARVELDRALSLSLGESASFDPDLDSPRRIVTRGRVVYIPEGCRSVASRYDLMVHFHGAPQVVEPAFERAGLDGVLVTINLGNGSGAYEDAYQARGSYDGLLASVGETVKDLCPKAAGQVRRVALTGWSAGYGAIQKILDRPDDARRIDAVLLADGLHVGFEGSKWARKVNPAAMAPFTLYADEAVAGRKLFAISHSSIQTPYASTTETANFLLDVENIVPVVSSTPGPRPGMVLKVSADRGEFHVRGFGGDDKAAHCDHLHAFGDILLPYLRERWEKPVP
jgi:hypothetical protein